MAHLLLENLGRLPSILKTENVTGHHVLEDLASFYLWVTLSCTLLLPPISALSSHKGLHAGLLSIPEILLSSFQPQVIAPMELTV